MANGGSGQGRNIWNAVKHPMTLFVIGIIATGASGYFFYQKGKSTAIAEAVEKGRAQGQAQGYREAEKAFNTNLPERLKEAYGLELENARAKWVAEGIEQGRNKGYEAGKKDGREEGRKKGYEDGHEDGFNAGKREGREEAAVEFSRQRRAEQDWERYENLVSALSAWALKSEVEPSNEDLKSQLLADARSLVEGAKELRAAYADQAGAFNSIMDDLEAALETRDFAAIRKHLRALEGVLEIRKGRFLWANDRIAAAFERFASR